MAAAEPISTGLYGCLVGHSAYNDQVGRKKKERKNSYKLFYKWGRKSLSPLIILLYLSCS